MLAFRILHEDEALLAVDKPAGFHSHPPEDKSIRLNPRWNGLAILERQLGQKLFPAHRLDRATSGLLILSKRREANFALQRQFQERAVAKTYFCLVRGTFRGETRIEAPLKKDNGEEEEAITLAEECASFSLSIPGPDGRDRVFTLVRATPLTGRYHQIRRHLARIGFPLVGDTRHGDRRVNRAFAELTGIDRLFLRCARLELKHPFSGEALSVTAPWNRDWHWLFDQIGVCPRL
jgi:tRNA pseudouridine65 synthase